MTRYGAGWAGGGAAAAVAVAVAMIEGRFPEPAVFGAPFPAALDRAVPAGPGTAVLEPACVDGEEPAAAGAMRLPSGPLASEGGPVLVAPAVGCAAESAGGDGVGAAADSSTGVEKLRERASPKDVPLHPPSDNGSSSKGPQSARQRKLGTGGTATAISCPPV